MKMSKSKVAVLMLFVVTVVYAVALVLSFQAYQSWKEEKLLQYPEPVRPYVDFEPFLASSYGILYLPFSMLLILAWVGLLVSLNLKKRGKKMRKTLSNIGAFVVLVLMILFFGSLYIVMTFLLAVVVKLNVWLAVAVSGGISLSLAYACACLIKKIGIKLEL